MAEPPAVTEELSPEEAARALRGALHVERTSLVFHYAGGAKVVPLARGLSHVIGRAEDASIFIDDTSLSRQHASVTLQEDGSVLVRDLGSTNGTKVAGVAITEAAAHAGQEIVFGSVRASLHRLSARSTSGREIEPHDAFAAGLRLEIERARHFGRSVAVLVLRKASDDGTPITRMLGEIEPELRTFDRLALYGKNWLELALPEIGLESAVALGRKLSSLRPKLLVGAALFPTHGTSAEEVLEAALAAARRASAQGPVSFAEDLGARTLPEDRGEALVCESAPLKETYRKAAKAARGALPVLILAETGVGKEVLARYVHESSGRAGPLVSVNCGAISASLLESTLFGHEKGAFTGADQRHKGVFESAAGGTVFLDEIGELPGAAQAALLRVLEHKRVTRVGSSEEIAVDVRVVAATHRDLMAMVTQGTFRQDLFYRLNALTIAIPPLRERPEDLRALIDHFLARANRENQRTLTLHEDARELLMQHAWPGNARELKNALERAVIICDEEVIGVGDLPLTLGTAPARPSAAPVAAASDAAEIEDFRATMLRLEREVLLGALRAAGNNQTHAARRLAMPLRTLVHKLKQHGIKKLGYGE